jgi:beta-glucanase (GH16 family)
VDWQRGSITFYVDGVQQGPRMTAANSRGQWVFDNSPMLLLINHAVGGEWPGPADASTPLPSTMKVDYVRILKSKP